MLAPNEYLPQNELPYTVHYGDYLPKEEEEYNEDIPCMPSDVIDERTTRARHFKNEEEAREYVARLIDRRKHYDSLRWLAFVYIQKSNFTVIKDYTEWLAMS